MINWETIIVALLLVLSAVVVASLGFIAGLKWEAPGAPAFLVLAAGLFIWSLTYALEIISSGLAAKTLWVQFQYIGIAIIPAGWFLFAQAYSGNENWAGWRRTTLIFIIPVITILIAFTNPMHGLLWDEFRLESNGPLSTFYTIEYGLWWWIFFVYAYGLLLWGSIVILQKLRTRSRPYRWQFSLIMISLVLPWLANASYLAGFSPIPQLDLSPFAFTISAIVLFLAMSRFRLFDLVPFAPQKSLHRLDAAAFVLDHKDRVVDLNNAAAVLLSEKDGEPEGRPVDQVFRWWEYISPDIKDLVENNQDLPIDLDGLRRYFNMQITPIRDRRKRLIARMVVLRDITEEKLAGEAMALAQVKTEFLAKVGHELRSPLTSILGVAEMLDYGVYGPITDEQRSAVRLISDSTQNMTRMVNDLLQQSKLERGTFKLDLTEFMLAELLNRVIDHTRPMAKVKNLELGLDLAPDVSEKIRGDSLRLYQIIINLMDNAVKYTLQGRIELRVFSPDPNHLAYQVIDTGVGIPKDIQRLIFNPFQQAEATQAQKESGFGLGLSIVKQLVSLMDGQIELESEVGKGSVFTVKLPLEPARDIDS
jgi:signal transduction histidine kinase